MTSCNFQNGVELRFLRTGVVLRVYEVDIRIERDRFIHARATISTEAAYLLSDRHDEENLEYEPVLLSIGGVTQGRYIFDPEEMNIVQGEEQATITLEDPLHLFNRGTITKTWDSVTPNVAIRTIWRELDDPHRAITGLHFVEEGLEDEVSRSNRQVISDIYNFDMDGETLHEQYSGDDRYRAKIARAFESATVWAGEQILDLTPGIDTPNYEGGFTFENTPLLEALMTVCGEFGLTAWVKEDGKLWIGLPELTYNEIIGIYGDPDRDQFTIREYNVTQGHSHINRVVAKGSSHLYPDDNGRFTANLYPEAEAWVNDGDEVLAFDEPLRIRSQEALEKFVRTTLVNEYASYKNGNIVFNGLASERNAGLVKLSIGDSIIVSQRIGEHCRRDVDGGHFVINEIHHQINTRVGWQVTVSLGGVPVGIESKSYMVDRQNLDVYRSVDDYWQEEEEEDDDGWWVFDGNADDNWWPFW
ncbi:hypothetical protein ACFQGT_09610 [Natrialbaceae archaeon GCM10025810]|uniref:hypothetical protein n=1 Tax=Halovalidus salilacus TaxID=3075124 RepID=UPI0036098C20